MIFLGRLEKAVYWVFQFALDLLYQPDTDGISYQMPARPISGRLNQTQHISTPLNYFCWIFMCSVNSGKPILDSKWCHRTVKCTRGTRGAVASVVSAWLGAIQPEVQYALRLSLFVITGVISGFTRTSKPLCNNNLSYHYSRLKRQAAGIYIRVTSAEDLFVLLSDLTVRLCVYIYK